MSFLAHRGYSAKYPENTLAAFEAALQHRARDARMAGIELDIRLTRDGCVAVFHDHTVKRDDVAVPVEQVSLSELRALSRERLRGEAAPELDDVLALVRHRCELWIEIKEAGCDKDTLMNLLAESLRRYGPAQDVVLHSFCPGLMRLALDRFSGTGIRFGALMSAPEQFRCFGDDLLSRMDLAHPHWKFLLKSEELFVRLGKPLMTWTIDREEDLASLVRGTARVARSGLPITVATNDLALLECAREEQRDWQGEACP